MARLHRFIHAVASGYAVLVANTLYTLVSIPLAFHFLSKKEFGLIAVVIQLSNYLSLIDLGMSASLARSLIDYKDRKADCGYGSTVLTAWLVQISQAAIILLGGVVCGLALGRYLDIPEGMTEQFSGLISLQCAALSGGFVTRIFSQILSAHHRLDINNYTGVGSFLVNLLVLWVTFKWGCGVYSLVLANILGWLFASVVSISACLKLDLLPAKGKWGRPSAERFRELFIFARNVFLITAGQFLVQASQVIIVAKTMGLEAAAVWSVAMRAFTMAYLICWRPFDMTFTMFSEMIARGERVQLVRRYKPVAVITFLMSGIGAVLFAFCNHSFMAIWTSQKVVWPQPNDWLLGIWLILLTIVRCHSWLAQAAKEVRVLPWIYIMEGIVFVFIAFQTSRVAGFRGLLLTSIACTSVFTLSYSVFWASRYFAQPLRELLFTWLIPMFKVLGTLIPLGFVLNYSLQSASAKAQFLITSVVLTLAGGYCGFRFGMTSEIKAEIRGRLPKRWRGRFMAQEPNSRG